MYVAEYTIWELRQKVTETKKHGNFQLVLTIAYDLKAASCSECLLCRVKEVSHSNLDTLI